MGKRPQKRSLRKEKDPTACCVSGLMSIFDFRHGRSTRKLLADKRGGNTQPGVESSTRRTTAPNSNDKCEDTKEADESEGEMADAFITSIKKLMEEEMVNEHHSEHGNLVRKRLKQRNRSSTKSIDEQKLSEGLTVETIIKELCQIHHSNTDSTNNYDMHSDQDYTVVQEKLSAAIEVFMSQRLDKSRDSRKDEKFMDALETINSYKDLFLKLIQDPNSRLVKHIKCLEDSQFSSSTFLEEVNLLGGMSKSREICQSSSKIVILKPGPVSSRNRTTTLPSNDSVENKVESEKNAPFSFTLIKRRLKNAMGKGQQETSSEKSRKKISSEHQNRGENLGWSSPNRNHFYTERFAKSYFGFRSNDMMIDKSKDGESTVTNGVSNLYLEAKKHISEMVYNEEANPELNRGQLTKSLGRLLSFREYRDSENDTEDGFVTARMRLSPRGVNENSHDHNGNLTPSQRILDNQSFMTEDNYRQEEQSPDVDLICETVVEKTILEGIPEIDRRTEATDHEEVIVIDVPKISIPVTPTSKDIKNDNVALFDEETPSQCLQLRSFEEGQPWSSPLATPSCSSVKSKVEDSEKVIDRVERLSPVSVLEPLFSKADISPASTMDRQVRLKFNPRKIHFEEPRSPVIFQGIFTPADDGETPFDYVEALLLGSDLNWDEYLLRWLSSDQILDPELFNEVELFYSRPHDQKLLFDWTNAVLRDACDRYFGCFIGISITKQSIRAAPRGMNLINEIWDGVELNLRQLPSPNLERLMKKDMNESGTWMEDLHLDVKEIAIEMAEAIFEELVEDTISCVLEGILEHGLR